jgi:hypothetical protein
LGLTPDARERLRVDVVAGMSRDSNGPRLAWMLQLTMITPRADDRLTITSESFEDLADLHPNAA